MRKQFLIKMLFPCFFLFVFLSCEKSKVNVPEVTTAEISAITDTTAQCGGTIISDGGATVNACGLCWSTGQNPTVADDTTNYGTGVGDFTSDITGLTPETTYYVRSYSTNSTGTGYGSAMSFTTEATKTGTVTDIDGNTYQTVKIGDQWWIAENLKVTHYCNGDAIPNVTGSSYWYNLTSGAYCNYNDDDNNSATYGSLYNWYAVNDSRSIAPEGWHVPSDEEWKTLEIYLGMSNSDINNRGWRRGTNEGGKLKEAGTAHWTSPNTSANNKSGFSALPSGNRYIAINNSEYNDIHELAGFWSSTEYESLLALYRGLSHIRSEIFRHAGFKSFGFSVRCVRD